MFKGADDLLAYIKEEGIETVDVRFCDLPGVMQHFTVPAAAFGIEVFEDGLNFDGSSITGFQKIHESDMSLLPDPTTAYVDPFRKSKTLNVNFFVHDPLTKEPYSRDPRNIARKAQSYLESSIQHGATVEAYLALAHLLESLERRDEAQGHYRAAAELVAGGQKSRLALLPA